MKKLALLFGLLVCVSEGFAQDRVVSAYSYDNYEVILSVNSKECDDSFLESWGLGLEDSLGGTNVFFKLKKPENIRYVKFDDKYKKDSSSAVIDLCEDIDEPTYYVNTFKPSINDFLDSGSEIGLSLDFINSDKLECDASLYVELK